MKYIELHKKTLNKGIRSILSIVLVIMLILAITPVQAKELDIEWERTYEGSDWFRTAAIYDDGYILFAITNRETYDRGVLMIKTDNEGIAQWNKTYTYLGGSTEVDDIVLTDDGDIIMIGDVESDNSTIAGGYILQMDENGNKVWGGLYKNMWEGLAGDNFGSHSIVAASDGYYLRGEFNDALTEFQDEWLVKINATGAMQWNTSLNFDAWAPYGEGIKTMLATPSGEIFVTSATIPDNEDVLLVKYDQHGNRIWSKTFGTDRRDFTRSILHTSDSGILINTLTVGEGDMEADLTLIKVDTDGNQLWQTEIDNDLDDQYWSIVETDEEYVVIGSIHGNWDQAYMLAFDKDGDFQWDHQIGGGQVAQDYTGIRVMHTDSGDLVVAGTKGESILLTKTSEVTEEPVNFPVILGVFSMVLVSVIRRYKR